MGELKETEVYEEELIDYEEEDEKALDSAKPATETVKKGYVGIHSSGFRDFLLKPELLRAIVDSGFEHPSEVQHECIPQAILGMDVICQAKSGMGKTAVFVLSTLQQIDPVPGQVAALVLCHTRELAYQICHEVERFSTYLSDIKVAVFYGGVNIKVHKDLLKNECPHIVVGTPGRILALTRDKDLGLKNVRHFILDECDKMLESLDMRRDVQEIFKLTPHDKQVMMFSATLSKEIRPVCKKFMQDPMEIYVDDEAKLTLHGLVQHYIKLQEPEKKRKLNDLLDALDFNKVAIFVKSVSRAEELNKLLVECNFPSICIHSGMSQEERLKRYKGFKEAKQRILVATDLVGLGTDMVRVNIVINYDMADSADTYLHRVERAGRFGTKGLVITFVSSAGDSEVLNQVQSRFEFDIKALPEQIDTSTYKYTMDTPPWILINMNNVEWWRSLEATSYLNELPEGLLSDCLSHARSKAALDACTHVLHNRFSDLWKRCPNLYFTSDDHENLEAFDEFVNFFITERGWFPVKSLTFRRHGTLYTSNEVLLNRLIEYVVDKGVKDVWIDLRSTHGFNPRVTFPNSLFQCSSMRRLKMDYCFPKNLKRRKQKISSHIEDFHLLNVCAYYAPFLNFRAVEIPFGVDWNGLKSLTIHNIGLTAPQSGVLAPFQNMGNLESLTMSEVSFDHKPKVFVISGKKLTKLTLTLNTLAYKTRVEAKKLHTFSHLSLVKWLAIEVQFKSREEGIVIKANQSKYLGSDYLLVHVHKEEDGLVIYQSQVEVEDKEDLWQVNHHDLRKSYTNRWRCEEGGKFNNRFT